MIVDRVERTIVAGIVLLLSFAINIWSAVRLRPITVEDCIRTRRIVGKEVQISQDGRLLAYVVKAPEISQNSNHYQLYVRSLSQLAHRENGRLLLEAESISRIKWLRGEQIAVRGLIKSESR